MKLTLNPVTNINSITVINDNFDKIEQIVQDRILFRDNPIGEPNTLEDDLDVNGKILYNVGGIETPDGPYATIGEIIDYVDAAEAAAITATQAAIDAAESADGIEQFVIDAETAATNAAASASAASASATAASGSATAASTSASNASTSATAASGSATTASTAATNAGNSATSASGSATTATTQAGIATGAASTATTQAGIATTQAGIATTAATNAAASYDSFDDRYLGAKSSDPTLDNDGAALLTGALYFNTSANKMKVYTGSAWVEVSPIDDSAYVKLTTNQTIAGTKTFSSPVVIPQATSDTEAVNKGQVYGVGGIIEQGDWTPVIYLEDVPATTTYEIAIGKYTRINKTVIINVNLRTSEILFENLSTDTASIRGLPFSPNKECISELCNSVEVGLFNRYFMDIPEGDTVVVVASNQNVPSNILYFSRKNLQRANIPGVFELTQNHIREGVSFNFSMIFQID